MSIIITYGLLLLLLFMTLHMWDCSLCVCIALFDYHCLIRLSLTSSKLSNDKGFNKTNVHLPSEWLVGKCTGTVRINKPLKKKKLQMHFSLQRCVKAELSLRCILHLTAKGSCQSFVCREKCRKESRMCPINDE